MPGIYRVGQKITCCTVINISKAGQNNSPNVKYSIILRTVQNLKVGNTNSISAVKYSMLFEEFFHKFREASSCLPSSNFPDCFQS